LVPPRSEAPPPPNCPLPPLPLPLPHITAPPPSPPESLESAIDANVLRRYSTTARSSQSSSFSPLHERLLSKSRDLLALSVSSIWSLSVEDDKGISTDYEEEEDANAIAEARRKASLSLEGLSLSLSIPSEDEDLLGSPSETSRPSLSTSSSSDSTQTERIKFLSVFDREPNLRLSPPGRTSSPSVSPRTQSTDQFGSNTSALDAGDEEDYRNLLRNTPGAFCWTPTEEVSLSELEKQKLEKLMKQKVRRSTSKAKVTM
jgi:predicted CopG family antitoxin